MSYASFWVLVITGILLTRFLSGVELEDTLLVKVFGYNNICVYFDYPPSTYVLPLLWAITLTLLLTYIGAHWLHMRAEVQLGILKPQLYRVLTRLKAFEAVTLISFSLIFAVNPHEDQLHTLFIHTAPFFLLQIGMVSLAMSNTLDGIKSGYWKKLELPPWFAKGAIAYCVVFALIVAFKIPYATIAMTGYPTWTPSPFWGSFAVVADKLFLVCAAVIPMAKAAYLLYFRSDKIDVVLVRSEIAS